MTITATNGRGVTGEWYHAMVGVQVPMVEMKGIVRHGPDMVLPLPLGSHADRTWLTPPKVIVVSVAYPLFTPHALKEVRPKVVTIFISSHLRYFYLAQPTQKICGLQAIPPASQFCPRLVFHGDLFDGFTSDTDRANTTRPCSTCSSHTFLPKNEDMSHRSRAAVPL